jgi:hypothetical protein
MQYPVKYITATSYDDGKELFDSKSRSLSGDLPRITVWIDTNNETTIVTSAHRREIYDSGYFGAFVEYLVDGGGSVATLSLPVDGYANLLDYLAYHPEIPITVRIKDNRFHWWSANPTSYGYKWSPYVENGKRIDGLHIGWERTPSPTPELTPPAVTWSQPAGPPPFEEFKSYKLRYLISNNGNLNDAEATLTTPASTGKYYTPCHADTVDFWTKAIEFEHYYSTKDKVELLATRGLLPSGFFVNSEDLPHEPQDTTTAKNKMMADPRFNLDNGSYIALFGDGVRAITDARATACEELMPTWQQDYSTFYGVRFPRYYATGFPTNAAFWKNGRKVSSLCVYPNYGSGDWSTVNRACNSLGTTVRDMAHSNIHLFHAWTSAGLNSLSTISQTIMFTKLFMVCGGYKIWAYDWDSKHHAWSYAAAYDDMQPYSDFILNGYNVCPPPAISRATRFSSYVYTHFYQIDSIGNAINANTWICCRTLADRTLFFAGTDNGQERTVTIKSPIGENITLNADPYGIITVI